MMGVTVDGKGFFDIFPFLGQVVFDLFDGVFLFAKARWNQFGEKAHG